MYCTSKSNIETNCDVKKENIFNETTKNKKNSNENRIDNDDVMALGTPGKCCDGGESESQFSHYFFHD